MTQKYMYTILKVDNEFIDKTHSQKLYRAIKETVWHGMVRLEIEKRNRMSRKFESNFRYHKTSAIAQPICNSVYKDACLPAYSNAFFTFVLIATGVCVFRVFC